MVELSGENMVQSYKSKRNMPLEIDYHNLALNIVEAQRQHTEIIDNFI